MIGSAALIGQAQAMDSCSGQYNATLIQPLPVPTVVRLDLHDSSPTNVKLASAFTNGLQQAGVNVQGQPTVKLVLTFSILGQGEGSGPGKRYLDKNATGWSNGSNAPWLQGGMTFSMPDMPRYDMFSPQQPAQSGLLALRVEARDAISNATDWVAVVQCTLQGSDNQLLAYQLGYRIGELFGKRVSQGPL